MKRHDTCIAHGRRLIIAASLLGLLMHPATARANGKDGWRDDAKGLIHYSGLRCPTRIVALTRTDIEGSVEETLASCTYQGADVRAVIQIVEPNTLEGELDGLEKRFVESGFKLVSGAASARRGLTFVVGRLGPSELRETTWPIRIGDKDHILWINYLYPESQPDVEKTYRAFVEMLRASQAPN